MSNKSSSSSALVLGAIALIAAGAGAALWYTQFAGTSEDKAISSVPSGAADGDEEPSVPAESGVASAEEEKSNEVEEKSNEDEEKAKADAEEYRKQYDHAVSMADKFMKGQRWPQAAEKISEAIDILPKVPSAASQILPLYNNRSASYEKSGPDFHDKALNDIALVLQLDARHMKARVRRARILEQKGKIKEALIDYTVHFYMEQSKGTIPSSSQKVEDLSKVIAYEQASRNLEIQLKEAYDKSGGFQRTTDNKIVHVRDLPAKNFLRTTLENFPSVSRWKVMYKDKDLQDLIEAYTSSCAAAADADHAVNTVNNIALQLDVVCCAIAKDSYKTAFNYLAKAPPRSTGANLIASGRCDLLETHSLLVGLEMYLRRNLLGAEDYWNGARKMLQEVAGAGAGAGAGGEHLLGALCAEAQLNLGNNETALSMFNEVILKDILKANTDNGDGNGDTHAAEREEKKEVAFPLFTAYLASVPTSDTTTSEMIQTLATEAAEAEGVSPEDLVCLAYVLMLRANVWTARAATNDYKMREDPITPARIDFELAFAVADAVTSEDTITIATAKHAKVQSLCKRIHLLASTKGLAGSMHTAEDVQDCKQFVELGKAIDPNNKTLSLLAIDVLAMDEKFDESVELVEQFVRNAEPDEGVPYVMKANILTHQGMSSAKNPADQEKTMAKLQEASALYEQAMKVEPGCVEARAQACQLKCIVGDMEGAAEHAEQVVKLARTRDEALDLEHLMVQTSSQIAALKELYAASQG